jgi:hypothetical protein
MFMPEEKRIDFGMHSGDRTAGIHPSVLEALSLSQHPPLW